MDRAKREFIFRETMDMWMRRLDIDEIIKRGFLEAPASAGHHGAYEGGLFDHSYTTMISLVGLTNDLKLRWNNPRSPYIVGMLHDLCKIDSYKLVEDRKYEYNKDVAIPGHGEKSVMLLSEFLQLTEEEIYCIRWHMGAYDDRENWQYYDRAIRKYPNVLYTHTADMISSKIEGI